MRIVLLIVGRVDGRTGGRADSAKEDYGKLDKQQMVWRETYEGITRDSRALELRYKQIGHITPCPIAFLGGAVVFLQGIIVILMKFRVSVFF